MKLEIRPFVMFNFQTDKIRVGKERGNEFFFWLPTSSSTSHTTFHYLQEDRDVIWLPRKLASLTWLVSKSVAFAYHLIRGLNCYFFIRGTPFWIWLPFKLVSFVFGSLLLT